MSTSTRLAASYPRVLPALRNRRENAGLSHGAPAKSAGEPGARNQ